MIRLWAYAEPPKQVTGPVLSSQKGVAFGSEEEERVWGEKGRAYPPTFDNLGMQVCS